MIRIGERLPNPRTMSSKSGGSDFSFGHCGCIKLSRAHSKVATSLVRKILNDISSPCDDGMILRRRSNSREYYFGNSDVGKQLMALEVAKDSEASRYFGPLIVTMLLFLLKSNQRYALKDELLGVFAKLTKYRLEAGHMILQSIMCH